jgi:hypothetical protein
VRPQAIRLAPTGGERYERQDISVRGVVWTGAAVAGFLLALGLALVWLERSLYDGRSGDRSGLPLTELRPLPELRSAPRLEIDDGRDYAVVLERQRAELDGQGRHDDGTWHIPIERAMRLTAERASAPRETPLPRGAP